MCFWVSCEVFVNIFFVLKLHIVPVYIYFEISAQLFNSEYLCSFNYNENKAKQMKIIVLWNNFPGNAGHTNDIHYIKNITE